ncbi:Periplasmic binding protein [uncultured archaeon]|nr:Periplasmic binding protein [uncultured archaeon]
MKKLIITIIVLFIIAGALFYFTQNFSQKNEVRIVALFPLTGGLAHYGDAAEKSAQIAVDEINSGGGINGAKLVVDYQDHQCSPQVAKNLFEQFYSVNGGRVFTSIACSGTVLAIAPMLEEKKAVLFSTLVTTPAITGVSPFVFRNWGSDDAEAKLFAEQVKLKGIKSIGVIYEETDYAKGLKISLEKYLADSNVNVTSESFVTGATDVRSQLSKLSSAGVEALFISPQSITSGDIVLKQMTELNFTPKTLFVNDNITKSSQLLSSYPILEGAIGADFVVGQGAGYDAFMKKFAEKYGFECPQKNICAGVYDAIYILAKSVKESGIEQSALADYLKNIDYNGISGRIRFDSQNDRKDAVYSLFVIKNGEATKQN